MPPPPPPPPPQGPGLLQSARPPSPGTQRAEIHAASVTHPSLAIGASRRAPRGRGAGRAAPGARALPAEGLCKRSAREIVGFPARQQIFAGGRKKRSRAAPPRPSHRSRGAGLGGPGRAVKDRNEARDLRGWGRGGRRATAKARNWSAAPRLWRAGAGGEIPSHSSSINLPWLRSVNKNGVNRPRSLCVWGGSGGQRCRGRRRRRRPAPARFARGRSASLRPAASSSPGAERGPAGPLIETRSGQEKRRETSERRCPRRLTPPNPPLPPGRALQLRGILALPLSLPFSPPYRKTLMVAR
ncbi:WAS/WASL-interacting protein family member 2-like [Lagenorhynchus albirostris]|uniref:WAS/WASL-interacting protein family member 2-like n=1 Tax=Lagenorhynchus albirostris TaxID=27610 RepID=UPI0028E70FF9|nr:WAS/WASL-interacting protein family member 2-like [Lagenorhynchus albirostris]